VLSVLRHAWDRSHSRQHKPDHEWTADLALHLDGLVEMRISHVREWISSNLARFKTSHENVEQLRRSLESKVVDLKESVQLCKMQCNLCHLLCIQSRHHEGTHNCQTTHECIHGCDYSNEHPDDQKLCGFRYSSYITLGLSNMIMFDYKRWPPRQPCVRTPHFRD